MANEFKVKNGLITPVVTSTVATGTAPFTVTSTTPVTNLSIGGNAATATTASACSGNSATATKATNLVGGNTTTLLGAIPYQSGTDLTTQLAPNVTTTKKFLRETGDGTNGTAPAWDTIVLADLPTITPAKGGTGVANGANNTITFTGNYTLGATLTGNTAVTFPTSGTLATTAQITGTNSGTNTGDQTNISGSSGSCTGNAATATTATNLSGGTVSGTTGTFSSSLSAAGISTTTNSITSGSYLNANNLEGTGNRSVVCTPGGSLAPSSDSRLKTEVFGETLPGLNEILKLKPHAYRWKEDIENRGDAAAIEVGFFGDETALIIPSSAPMNKDGYFGFYDRPITAALVNAVKEQQITIANLMSRIAALESKNQE